MKRVTHKVHYEPLMDVRMDMGLYGQHNDPIHHQVTTNVQHPVGNRVMLVFNDLMLTVNGHVKVSSALAQSIR